MKKQFTIRQILYFIIGIVGLTFVAAFQMKVNIGVSPWDGLGRSISYMTGLRIGTVSIVQSTSCVTIQLLLLRKQFGISNILQLIVGLSMGTLINFWYYTFFASLTIDSYFVALVLFTLSVIGSAVFVSILQTAEVVNLPLEGLCQVISDKTKIGFSKIRQYADVISVALILLITFIGQVPISLREGTIISMILFGPAMGVIIPYLENWLHKNKIIPTKLSTNEKT